MISFLLAAAISGEPVPPRVQWVVYTAPSWCGPCRESERDYREWMEKSGWRIGDKIDSHVRLIDIDLATETDHDFSSVPTFVLVRDGKEVKRFARYPGREYLVSEYHRQWKLTK